MTARQMKAAWLVFGVLLLLAAVWLMSSISADVERTCEAQGGHVSTLGRERVCLSPDGRVL